MAIVSKASPPRGISPRSQSFAIVGAGRLGTALGVLLQRTGHQITGFSSQSGVSLDAAAALLGLKGSVDPAEAARGADAIVLSVPDDALAEACGELCDGGVIGPATFVVHTSGARGLEVLELAARLGAQTLAVHVLQSIPDAAAGIGRIPGSWFGVTCEDDLRPWAEELVSGFGGKVLWVRNEDRPVYHLAAVIASNFLVTLADLAGRTFGNFEPFVPLMRGTLENIERLGPGRALTGPVARGDAGTLERHIAAIDNETVRDAYSAMSSAAIDLAVRSGRLSKAKAEELRRVVGK